MNLPLRWFRTINYHQNAHALNNCPTKSGDANGSNLDAPTDLHLNSIIPISPAAMRCRGRALGSTGVHRPQPFFEPWGPRTLSWPCWRCQPRCHRRRDSLSSWTASRTTWSLRVSGESTPKEILWSWSTTAAPCPSFVGWSSQTTSLIRHGKTIDINTLDKTCRTF